MVSPKLTTLSETRPRLLRIDRKKSSLSRRLDGDRLSQERRDESEYPKPRISSQVSPPLTALPIEWGREAFPESNLRPRVILYSQIWLLARDGSERSCLSRLFRLTPEERTWQRLWRGPELTDSSTSRWNQKGKPDMILHLVMPLRQASSGGSGGFMPVKVSPG